jgi:hypothetical protein
VVCVVEREWGERIREGSADCKILGKAAGWNLVIAESFRGVFKYFPLRYQVSNKFWAVKRKRQY